MTAQQTVCPATEAVDELISVLCEFRRVSSSISAIGDVLVRALQDGKKILTCGNGGSAADALHMAEELVGKYKSCRRSLAAISLVADPTLITCIGNDFGYEFVFSRQIEGLAKNGDVLVAFSSSGNSANILNAVTAAKERNVICVALLGNDGGAMAGKSDYELIIPSTSTARIQEIHTLVLHSLLEQIETEFADHTNLNHLFVHTAETQS